MVGRVGCDEVSLGRDVEPDRFGDGRREHVDQGRVTHVGVVAVAVVGVDVGFGEMAHVVEEGGQDELGRRPLLLGTGRRLQHVLADRHGFAVVLIDSGVGPELDRSAPRVGCHAEAADRTRTDDRIASMST